MKRKPTAARRKYPQLLKEYEQYLKRRELNGEIKEVTRKTFLNDANRVLECLLAESSVTEIKKIMLSRQYKGYYGRVIRDLKAIMAGRTL
jgi:hypothetical protein